MIPYMTLILLGGSILFFVVIGMARYDLATIRFKRIATKTPNAKVLRERPIIYIKARGFIEKTQYKKLVISLQKFKAPNTLALYVDKPIQLKPRTVITAVQGINTGAFRAITFTPLLTDHASLKGLFYTYALLARLPFETARAGIGVTPHIGLIKQAGKSPYAFEWLAYVAKLLNLMLFIYACFAASIFNQPELILMYVIALSFWLTWSILRYPYFSFTKKAMLLLLAPVSFVYFIYLVITAVIRFPNTH